MPVWKVSNTHFHQLPNLNTFLLDKKIILLTTKITSIQSILLNIHAMYLINISANYKSIELKNETENNVTLPITIEQGLQHCSSGHLDRWSWDIWPRHPLPHSQILTPCCWILWPCWTNPGQKTHVQLCLLEFKHNILIKTKVRYKNFLCLSQFPQFPSYNMFSLCI